VQICDDTKSWTGPGGASGRMGGNYGAAMGRGPPPRSSPGNFNPSEPICEDRHVGIISKFDPYKKFGFINCDETKALFGGDVFLSDRQILQFDNGDMVTFQYFVKNGKPQAVELRAVDGLPAGNFVAVGGGGQEQQRQAGAGANFNPREPVSQEQHYGTITKFDPNKKFGFIECAELNQKFGCDVFLSDRQIGSFENGQTVSFYYMVKNGKPQAINLGGTGLN